MPWRRVVIPTGQRRFCASRKTGALQLESAAWNHVCLQQALLEGCLRDVEEKRRVLLAKALRVLAVRRDFCHHLRLKWLKAENWEEMSSRGPY